MSVLSSVLFFLTVLYTKITQVSMQKQRYIAGAAKWSTKPLSKILTSIFTAVKMGLHKYHDTCFSRSGVNQMWIFKTQETCLRL